MRIAITGFGVVSALGKGVDKNLESLLSEKTGIGKSTLLQSDLAKTHLFGEFPKSNEEIKESLGIDKKRVLSRTSLLGILAVKEALDMAGDPAIKSTLISGTSVGGMDLTEQFYKKALKQNDYSDIAVLQTHDCGETSFRIASHFNCFDAVHTISTACSSSANAMIMGGNLLKTGKAKRIIAGGIDPLSMFTANGFNSLMILDDEWCKPFSANRKGLNLGEGAAFLVLENEADVEGRKIYGYLSGYANTNDAYHQTASSPDGSGALRAMKGALEMAGLQASDIHYINAHGTGTANNDQAESAAINSLFKQIPPVSSTKAYTGHTLGAAGSIEAVFSLLAMQEQVVFPNLNHLEKMEENDWLPVTSIQKQEIEHVLSNSFGFGGNNTSLIFSKH